MKNIVAGLCPAIYLRQLCYRLFAAAVFLVFPSWAHAAIISNLAADWSDIANPNGLWQINKSPGTAFGTNQADYWGDGTNQMAWADNPSPGVAHVPVWMLVTDLTHFGSFVDLGTVVVHGAETPRTGTELTSVVWTSPLDGQAQISGGAWVDKSFNRPMAWEVRKNGAFLTDGLLSQGDSFDKSNPFDFADGSGGASALTLSVAVGDKLELLVYRQASAPYATFVGVDLSIHASQVPEPTTLAVWSLLGGIGLVVGHRRRRRKAA